MLTVQALKLPSLATGSACRRRFFLRAHQRKIPEEPRSGKRPTPKQSEHHAEHVATLTKHLEELQKAEETHARQAPDVKLYLEQMVARQEDILRRIRVLEHPGEQYKGFVGKLREAALTLTVCAMVFAVGLGWMLCWWYLHRR